VSARRVLIVTDKIDGHADRVIDQLELLGAQVLRLNTQDLLRSYSFALAYDDGAMTVCVRDQSGREIVFPRDLVTGYFRKPEPVDPVDGVDDPRVVEFVKGESREFLRCLYALPRLRWVNNPLAIPGAEAKFPQLVRASELGLRVPRTVITNDPHVAQAFSRSCRNGVVCKTLSAPFISLGQTTKVCFTQRLSVDQFDAYCQCVQYAPTLVQEYVPKKNELRVTVIGRKVFACEIDSQSSREGNVDWRRAHPSTLKHSQAELPPKLEESILSFVRSYGLEFSALDLIRTPEDDYVFLENNPNGQWYWIEMLTGMPMAKAMAELLME
jgi:glutathione synthase/RimK-type ligase-like ATP-grasp enzyme